jgi:exosome complex exonuclease RRP6
LSILTRQLDPYRYDINNLDYPAHMFRSQMPISFKPLEETPFTSVSTRAQFDALIDKLRESRKIAIDLEYRSYRAYLALYVSCRSVPVTRTG